MTRRLKIAIASAGRFHVLDLARELHVLGHEVKFYSYVPRSRTRQFGLPDECHVSLLPFALPAVAWEKLAPRLAPKLRERLLYATLNHAVMLRLQPCDIFHCMSGIYLEAAQYARRRFGARIWVVRGSQHILSQDEILAETPGAERPSPLAIKRELAGYALADRIAIASKHVEESFHRDSGIVSKLVRNPYGVDLRMFPLAANRLTHEHFTYLTVGHWSRRKGSDVLASALVKQGSGVRLIHVGKVIDLAFPESDGRFIHFDHVPQRRLTHFYAQADAFVFPSREDGFGTVLPQALASGLPVICTDRTGGTDLAHTPSLAARITVVPAGNVEALAAAMAILRDYLCAGEGLPPLTEADREPLSWTGFGRRYSDHFMRDLCQAETLAGIARTGFAGEELN